MITLLVFTASLSCTGGDALPPPPIGTTDTTDTTSKTSKTSKASKASSGCADPGLLEPRALMGKLTPADIRCIEKTISKVRKQTEKIDFSVVLLINADARKDTKEWMRLAERHLREISQADPVICFKYAVKLRSRGRYSEAIRWADRALENKDKFPSSTHARWTSDLLMIRARSGYDLYKAADKKYTQTRNPMDSVAAEKTRNNAKVFAKEWLDFARETGRDVDKAKKLCASAAGTTSYCN